jgi:hypothetical protein
MLALGLLRTLNRFRLYLQEVIVARNGYLPNELRYQSNRRRHSIAFLIEYVLSSEETEMAMLASPKMFFVHGNRESSENFPPRQQQLICLQFSSVQLLPFMSSSPPLRA